MSLRYVGFMNPQYTQKHKCRLMSRTKYSFAEMINDLIFRESDHYVK
jgi:hypothetical protein